MRQAMSLYSYCLWLFIIEYIHYIITGIKVVNYDRELLINTWRLQ